MPKTEANVEAGKFVRAVRDSLGMSRKQFGVEIGVEPKTVQQVELGYQALHHHKMEHIMRLNPRLAEASRTVTMNIVRPGMGEREQAATAREWAKYNRERAAVSAAIGPDVLRTVIRLVRDEGITAKAAKIADVLGCSEEEAIAVVVTREMEGRVC